jgi:methylmalonyl-CoA/ethylmalonyl-CoA epimerase
MTDLKFGFHHAAISVPDLTQAVDWYGDVLGFSLEETFSIPSIPAKVAIVRNGDLRIEIFEVPDAHPIPDTRKIPDEDNKTHGNKHVAFTIENVDVFGDELKKRGADIVWIKRMEFGANIFIRDIAGNLIEFVEAPVGNNFNGCL